MLGFLDIVAAVFVGLLLRDIVIWLISGIFKGIAYLFSSFEDNNTGQATPPTDIR